jgi:hypothetical protein
MPNLYGASAAFDYNRDPRSTERIYYFTKKLARPGHRFALLFQVFSHLSIFLAFQWVQHFNQYGSSYQVPCRGLTALRLHRWRRVELEPIAHR